MTQSWPTLACEQQTHFRSSLLSRGKIFRRERSDDRKCVCMAGYRVWGAGEGPSLSTHISISRTTRCFLQQRFATYNNLVSKQVSFVGIKRLNKFKTSLKVHIQNDLHLVRWFSVRQTLVVTNVMWWIDRLHTYLDSFYRNTQLCTSTGEFYKKLNGACLKFSGLTFLDNVVLC